MGGINHYQYAPNPVNWVDPFGLLCKDGQARVKAALDANPELSDDLKNQIKRVAKRKQSGCTADEMIEQIAALSAATGGLDLFLAKLSKQFIDDYKAEFPNTTLSDKDLLERYQAGKEYKEATRSLYNPNSKSKPEIDIPAKLDGPVRDVIISRSKELKRLQKLRVKAQKNKEAINENDIDAKERVNQLMVNLSEAIGEESTRLVMAQEHPEFKEIPSQLPGKGKQGQFDLIYYKEDKNTGKIITVEAKGGASTKGSRKTMFNKQAEQGSPEYRDSITLNMEEKIEKAQQDPRYDSNSDEFDPKFKKQVEDLEETLEKLIDADDDKLISTKLVSQRLNDDGSLKLEAGETLKVKAELSSFKNDKWVPDE
ncbi:hypothetical protein [Pseudoalteromonas sp. Z9A5]|uniref:hypothetical protein n=1 Tax=Pseudoalteromonas sp. Z9A5 TaxID=2686355 RepID=UPI001409C439|nr:hypothetical protein [Pseudoalteromonas sp. Z9A5]